MSEAPIFSGAAPSRSRSSHWPSYALYRSPRQGTSRLHPPDHSGPASRSPSPSSRMIYETARDELSATLEALQRLEPDDLTSMIHLGSLVLRLLVEAEDKPIKEVFRQCNGFVAIVQLLASLERTSDQHRASGDSSDQAVGVDSISSGQSPQGGVHGPARVISLDPSVDIVGAKHPGNLENRRVEVFRVALSILTEALSQVPANLAAFQQTVGWSNLAASCSLSAVHRTSPYVFYSALLGVAFGDVSKYAESLLGLQLDLESQASALSSESTMTAYLEQCVSEEWNCTVLHAEAISIILDSLSVQRKSVPRPIPLVIAYILEHAVHAKHNQVALADGGIGSKVLTLVNNEETEEPIRRRLARLSKRLLSLGVSNSDGRQFFRMLADPSSNEKDAMLDLLLDIAPRTREAPAVTFDMSLHGHASIAFSSLRKPFPPGPASKGWTFSTTITITRTEPSMPLDLVHFFDAQHTCSVKLTIDPATCRLHYQTARERPATIFKRSHFSAGARYHIVLMHVKPRGGTGPSPVQLYVNGVMLEEQSADWPSSPSSLGASVRTVFGRPPKVDSLDLAFPNSTAGRQTNRLLWSLGPSFALDALLPPDIPLILFELSPRYGGNAQDSLGRFLTYRASTNINLRLDTIAREMLSQGDQNSNKDLSKHPLVRAVAGKSAGLFHEDSYYFALNGSSVAPLPSVRRSASDSHSSAAGPSDTSLRPAHTVLLNQALLLTREGNPPSYGYAKMYGDPVISIPQGLDETIWTIGGSPILLYLLDGARTQVTLRKTLALFFDMIQNSWRLSEDIERLRGYEILALLLRQKAHLFDESIVRTLLRAIGINEADPENAALVNPFLYRLVILDFDIWSGLTEPLQRLHLEHFTTLLRSSKHRRFNVKRIARMHVVKKLLYALRANLYPAETVPLVVAAIRACALSSFSDPTIRVISSYLAAELCKTSEMQVRRPVRRGTVAQIAPTQSSSLYDRNVGRRPSFQTERRPSATSQHRSPALQVFAMLSDLILDRPAFANKWASVCNIKWTLIFFHPSAEPLAVSLSCTVLARLLSSQPRYTSRLNISGGFKVLERLLPRFWSQPMVISTCWSMLLGRDWSPSRTLFESFAPLDGPSMQSPVENPHIMRAIVSCFRAGIRATAAKPSASGPTPNFAPARKSKDTDSLLRVAVGDKPFTHGRKRSQSMNMDIKSLSNALRDTSEQSRLTDTVRLMRAYSDKSPHFRDLLFSPIILRGLVDAILPNIPRAESFGRDTGNLAETLCLEVFNLLAQSAVEYIFVAGSSNAIGALLDAVPPTDLVLQSHFRSAIFARVIEHVEAALPRHPIGKRHAEAEAALAAFVELASDDILLNIPLQAALYDLIIILLPVADQPAQGVGQDEDALRSLLISFNHIVLYRLALDNRTDRIFAQLCEYKVTIFAQRNADATFFQAIVNRALFHLQEGDEDTKRESLKILQVLTLSRHSCIEPVLVTGTPTSAILNADADTVKALFQEHDAAPSTLPYEAEWVSFTKSLDTLKSAAHLARVAHVKELLDRVDDREAAIAATERRMVAWHQSLCDGEALGFAKFQQDARELSVFATTEWQKLREGLERERALLGPEHNPERRYRFKLDPTEGPRRMRKKLQELPLRESNGNDKAPYRQSVLFSTMPSAPVRTEQHDDSWHQEGEALVEGGAEEIAHDPATIEDESEIVEAAQDDKFRRVLRSLERGDIIEDVFNTSRVVGIECRGCLLIIGRKCLYLVDDVLQRADGELVNVWEAPPEERDTLVVAALASDGDAGTGPTDLVTQLEGEAQTRKWAWSSLQACHRRAWLHRKTAVEIFFEDGQSYLLVLSKAASAAQVYKEMRIRAPAAVQGAESLRDGIKESAMAPKSSSGSLSSRLAGAVLGRSQNPGAITQAWIQRQISSFEYLMALNTIAGRSFNDLTQYPVFPWLIADWTSSTLDLTEPQTFRKLELPMGAQGAARRSEFEERYSQLEELAMDDAQKPFHYGTHYSTAATVCGFLIRLRPYEKVLLTLQGGNFDLADRIFSSLGKAWMSASELSRGDVRELVPDAFIIPDFLVNNNRFAFGQTQGGVEVDNVELPPWAHDDPTLFILKHREALECDYVSDRLHHWIDLIFGYRSRGEAARESTNVFHPLSYDDGVDLDAISSGVERSSAAAAIHSFGQTPVRLFQRPHPARQPSVQLLSNAPLQDRFDFVRDMFCAVQGIAPIRTLKACIHFIYPSPLERAFASPKDCIVFSKLNLSISFGHLDNSIRMFHAKDPTRAVGVTEQTTSGDVTCFVQSGPDTLMTGSSDGLVTRWKVETTKRELAFQEVFRGHSASILCIAASPAWSIAVSGSEDGTAIIWDTNRGLYVHSLRNHEGSVHLVCIDEENSYVATACGPDVFLWSINGELISKVSTSASISEPVASLAFYERDVLHGRLAVLLTGHRGKAIAWSCEGTHGGDEAAAVWGGHERETSHSSRKTRKDSWSGAWKLTPYHVFEHRDRLGPSTMPLITAIKSTPKMLFTGDELGRLYSWTLPGAALHLPDTFSPSCMHEPCSKRFGVLESRRSCGGCGGLFCSSCAEVVPSLANTRFCPSCRIILATVALVQ